MKHDFKEHRGRSGLSHTELAQEARSWKIRGIAQLVLAAVTVMFLTRYKLRDSFFFLAVGLGCAVIMVILLLLSSRCPICGHEIRRWERHFGTLFFRCPDCGFSIHAGKEEAN